MNIRIAGIERESVTDGPGLRSVIYFQGCPHACDGCHNPQTWDDRGGLEYNPDDLMAELRLTSLISGVTFSGGEPFAQAPAAARIGAAIKARGLDLWVYTGFVWEDLLTHLNEPGYAALLSLANVVMDGPFIQALRWHALPFRGSVNQRAILAVESLRFGKVIEWQPVRMNWSF